MQFKEIVEPARIHLAVEFDQKVDIAGPAEIVRGGRTKDVQPCDMMFPAQIDQFLTVFVN
jgi:hypothetical protein